MTNITEPGRIPESRKQFHAPSALAIDIGGTKTAFAWVGADGGIIDSFRVPTPAPETARDEALAVLGGAPVEVEIVVIDRAGKILARAH